MSLSSLTSRRFHSNCEEICMWIKCEDGCEAYKKEEHTETTISRQHLGNQSLNII